MLHVQHWEMVLSDDGTYKRNDLTKSSEMFMGGDFASDPASVLNKDKDEWIKMTTEKAIKNNRTINRAEVVEKMRVAIEPVLEKQAELCQILERHEERIVRRWNSKSRVWKENKLRKAAENVASIAEKGPRADIAAYFRFPFRYHEFVAAEENVRSAIFQQLCHPDLHLKLAEGDLLPRFLKSRGRNEPKDFILQDANNFEIIRHLGFLNVQKPSTSDLWLVKDPDKAQTIEDYCNVVDTHTLYRDFHTKGENTTTFMTWELFTASSKVHRGMLHILVELCHEVLADLPRPLTTDSYPIRVEPPLIPDPRQQLTRMQELVRDAHPGEHKSSIAEFLEEIVVPRAEHAKFDLWTARENPGYLNELLLEARESYATGRECRTGTNIQIPDILTKADWKEVLRIALTNLFVPICAWQKLEEVTRECVESLEASKQFQADRGHVHKERDGAVARLLSMLRMLPYSFWRLFQVSMYGNKHFQATFKIDHRGCVHIANDDSWMRTFADFLFGVNMYPKLDYFDQGRFALQHLRHHKLVEPKDQKMLSSTSWKCFQDCLLLEDFRSIIAASEPWAFHRFVDRDFKFDTLEKDEFGAALPQINKLINTYCNEMADDDEVLAAIQFQGARISNNRLHYPESKPPSKARTEQMQAAEKTLAGFWSSFETFCGSLTPYYLKPGEIPPKDCGTADCPKAHAWTKYMDPEHSDYAIRDLPGKYALSELLKDAWPSKPVRTTPDGEESESSANSSPTSSSSNSEDCYVKSAQIQLNAWYTPPSSPLVPGGKFTPIPKEKIKTRRVAVTLSNTDFPDIASLKLSDSVGHIDEFNPKNIVFPLSKKAAKAVCQIFLWLPILPSDPSAEAQIVPSSPPSPGAPAALSSPATPSQIWPAGVTSETQASELTWKLFCKLWTEIGFSVSPVTGSIYDFRPVTDAAKEVFKSRFQEHKPHPTQVIEPRDLLKVKRRLEEKYGVKRDWFTRKKGGEE